MKQPIIKNINEDLKKEFVLIPKTVFWTFIVTVIIGLAGSFVNTQIKFVQIEKEIQLNKTKTDTDIALLRLRFDKDLEIFNRIENKVTTINDKVIEIDKKLITKEDKKYK